ncbi:hypothetical protein AGABI2DRAFT_194871, partial [Agaricus bisporus var. bisporus H97]|uniref:hypothetical protein n=1 Tax=Agaricus bisporus var. bisporus (strain H97 / ATCC MYA-4626 / FGSC 10389) TaxID=936046 RepID=UPI00029F558E
MLLKDVPPPDWSLQDEIGSIVRQILAPVETNTKTEEDAELDHDSDRDDEDTYMRHLAELITPVIETRLESLFAIICAHTVARPDSMQNRIEPLTWDDLSNILSSPMASHLVDETVLQNVVNRMQTVDYNPPSNSKPNAISSPSPATALRRQSLVNSSRSRLNGLLSTHDASLFQQ